MKCGQLQGETLNFKDELQNKGYVQLRQFLPIQVANELLDLLEKNSHPLAWRLLTRPYGPYTSLKDGTIKHCRYKEAMSQAIQANNNRQFAFSFWRSSNRYIDRNGMLPIIEQFKERLLDWASDNLESMPELTDCFAAKFNSGQFIGHHTDGSAGKYAFIYQLSKSWLPKYGGQLVLYPKPNRFYRRILNPEFNTLSLLKLDHPMPHSVKMLKTPQHKERYTISGWIK